MWEVKNKIQRVELLHYNDATGRLASYQGNA